MISLGITPQVDSDGIGLVLTETQMEQLNLPESDFAESLQDIISKKKGVEVRLI